MITVLFLYRPVAWCFHQKNEIFKHFDGGRCNCELVGVEQL